MLPIIAPDLQSNTILSNQVVAPINHLSPAIDLLVADGRRIGQAAGRGHYQHRSVLCQAQVILATVGHYYLRRISIRSYDQLMLQATSCALEDQIHPRIEILVSYCLIGGNIRNPLRGVIADEEVCPAGELPFPDYLTRIGVLKGHADSRGVVVPGEPEYDLRRSEEHHLSPCLDHEPHLVSQLALIFYEAQGQIENISLDRSVI